MTSDIALLAAAIVAALMLLIVVILLQRWFEARRIRRRVDDLTALADTLADQRLSEIDIAALRALFHADQQPEPRRHK